MKRTLVCTLLLLPAIVAAAGPPREEATVSGRVTNASGTPIAAANVSLDALGIRAVTAADGRYRLLVPAARLGAGGKYRISASALGHEPAVRQVTLRPGAQVTMDFQLATRAIVLEGLVASATGEQQRTREVGSEVATLQGRAAGVRLRGSSSVSADGASLSPGAAGRLPEGFDTEDYAKIDENPFLAARANPLSTFAIDVDAASYSNVRRFLREGRLPPRDAVRIEELVNYFTYDYPDPSGEHPFSVVAEVGECPWNPAHRLVHIGLQGRRMDARDLPPSNLVFLVDVSGSMQPENKLPLVKRSLRMLVEQLRPQDRISLVVYAGAAGVVLEGASGDRREEILEAVERLEAGGSTAGGAGIRLAYDVARRQHREGGNNRVVLATDGDFNVGVSSDAEMFRLVEEKREQGTFLTVLGFGMGNLKDNKLEGLADRGNGNYAYIDDLMEARKVLVSEMGGTLFTIAKDVKLQVEFNPARIASYKLIGYENRLLAREDFNDD
ncbi:MAG TPA: von Willebrand factor type A domain-containing protein, partial [Longimicrobium sp.]|nr:von Willebrand factor type A domain-containing protein [Longimicrobium sp.]